MSTERKGIELFVGLFLLIGLGMIAAMVLLFGRVGQGWEKYYPLTVEFPNASGLVKGSDVLLSGARIGSVEHAPRLTGKGFAVATDLRIREGVAIPRKASFLIRTSGMLGDSYVEVAAPASFDPADVFAPGETAIGGKAGGLDDLTAKGGVFLDTLNRDVLLKLSSELDEIQAATTAINEKLLSERNLKNLEDTIGNLKTTTAQFAETSKGLDRVVGKAGEVIDSAKGTMKTVDSVAGDLRLAIADVRKVADSTKKTVDSAKGLIGQAAQGDGPLGALMSDEKTAEDLKALISNLRRSGVLFYKDRGAAPAATPRPLPPRR